MIVGVFHVLLWVFHKSFEPNTQFTLKMDSDVPKGSTVDATTQV